MSTEAPDLDTQQPECAFCGGLHYGSPTGHCPYRCDTCGCDIRDGKHILSPTGLPTPICPFCLEPLP